MGLLSRLWPKGETRRVREAREREHDGDLAAAADLFEEAGMLDDAARVLLLRADAEPSAEKRIAFCALAAQKAETEELKKKALGRKALCAFDVLKAARQRADEERDALDRERPRDRRRERARGGGVRAGRLCRR